MAFMDDIDRSSIDALARESEATGVTFAVEDVLEPDLPIVDPHHHLWENPANRYLLPELLRDLYSGHDITHTVFIETGAMYRKTGPVDLQPIGETEFVNGIAAMSASGGYGPCAVNAGIVSYANLSLGEKAGDVLDRQAMAAGGRLRGIRNSNGWDPYPLFGGEPRDPALRLFLTDPTFQQGVAALASRDLVFDAWCVHTQIKEVTALARAVPQTTIVLDHMASPLGIGPYAGRHDEIFAAWKADVIELAREPNVVVKLGGLGMVTFGSPYYGRRPPASSMDLASEWRPYIETSIEAFGVDRSMFESNFPVDRPTCSYRTLWNAFKILAAGASREEKSALFTGTAKRVYRLET